LKLIQNRYFENKLWFIDVSQAVEAIHPNAKLFLFRDCCNVTRFFKDLGVEKMFSETELFFYITMEAVNATNEVQLLKDVIIFFFLLFFNFL